MPKFELSLVEVTTYFQPPPTISENSLSAFPVEHDPSRSKSLLGAISESALKCGADSKSSFAREETDSSSRHNENWHRDHPPSRVEYYGGMPGQEYITTETITYACASIAAFAVFVRNVLGTAKDWRDLRAGRKVKALVDGREIEVASGDDLLAVVKAAQRGGTDSESVSQDT